MQRIFCLTVLIALAFTASRNSLAGDAIPAEQVKFFETNVRPLLVERCQKCHGEKSQKSELRLDSLEAAMAGGKNGAAIVPGKPAESLLIDAVQHNGFEMPPDGKLKDEEIASLQKWIELGAPWPGDHAVSSKKPSGPRQITDADRQWWAFQTVRRPEVPEAKLAVRNDVDRFIAARLAQEGMQPSPEASKAALARRVYFDLTGLPPTPDELAAYVKDESIDAYEKLVDRLLDSPRYGERWARHWLDLVRYAESDGYKQDDYRPDAWRYRDYVIEAFQKDKPYNEFIREQLAGDELAPHSPEALVATGYLQLGIYEYNQRDVPTQWNAILNELTDVTADVFLGQGLACARCHDHKFDPILQKDYFRLRAYFEPYSPRFDVAPVTPDVREAHTVAMKAWLEKTSEIRAEMTVLEKEARDNVANSALKKFPVDMQALLFKSREDRTPGEQQLFDLAWRQVSLETDKIDYSKKLKDEKLTRWQELKKQLAESEKDKPAALPTARTGSDIGAVAPPTFIPGRKDAEAIAPGPLSVLDERPAVIPTPPLDATTTGRRSELAQWIASPENPLTARVMVNRIWQYHFGRGLVSTSSDFGHLGEAPSHPELLDYLASRFVENNWSIKSVHRLIVTSAAYRQSSATASDAKGTTVDPLNRLVWRQNLRRLDAEQIRDAILSTTGELELVAAGPGVDVQKPRRTIFTKMMRNKRDPLLDVFDVPEGIASTPQRNATTTPLQSLLMVNSLWMIDRTKALAARLMKETDENGPAVDRAYELCFGRSPSENERSSALAFLADQPRSRGLTDLCHALLNSNEFLFVD